MTSEPLYQRIYEDQLGKIRNGIYQPGDRLPSEKELSDSYGVSRITSKKALELLSERGFILRHPGKGSFVATREDIDEAFESEEKAEAPESGPSPSALPDRNQKNVIGVIFDSFSDTFGADLIRGIEYECRQRGVLMFFQCTYGSREAEKTVIRDMIRGGAIGIIMMCTQGENYNEDVLKMYLNHFPLILLDRQMEGISLPVVTTDNYRASCDLVNWLIDHGHSKICFVSHSSLGTSTVRERFRGYQDTMHSHGFESDERMRITDIDKCLPSPDVDWSEDDVSDNELVQYIQNNPDVSAYFAINHELGMVVYKVLQTMGIRDKTVAFFDGYDEAVDPLPVFPHIMQDQYQIGVVAVRLLARKLKGEEVTGRENIPYTLVTPKE